MPAWSGKGGLVVEVVGPIETHFSTDSLEISSFGLALPNSTYVQKQSSKKNRVEWWNCMNVSEFVFNGKALLYTLIVNIMDVRRNKVAYSGPNDDDITYYMCQASTRWRKMQRK